MLVHCTILVVMITKNLNLLGSLVSLTTYVITIDDGDINLI